MTRVLTALILALGLSASAVAQSTPEASGDSDTAVVVSEDTLERHTGGYALQPGVTLSITRDATRLFAHVPGQDVFEMTASSETEFSVIAFDAQITFNRAADGTTESLTLNQNGMAITADRIE